MKIGLIVMDDGIYIHHWAREFLQHGDHTICVGACLNPFFARNFNPQKVFVKAILDRTSYYGLGTTLKFGWRFLNRRVADVIFRFSGRGHAESVRSILSMAGIPLIPIPDQNVNAPAFLARLKTYKPDVLVGTFSQKAGENLRGFAPLGCLNIHFSCLPENAGREPVFWSLLLGKGYGLTVYRIGAELDSGQMLIQLRLDEAGLISLDAAIHKVCTYVPDALSAALSRLETGTAERLPPPDLNPWPGSQDIKAFLNAGYRFI